jgi:hypothetical protein
VVKFVVIILLVFAVYLIPWGLWPLVPIAALVVWEIPAVMLHPGASSDVDSELAHLIDNSRG